MSRLSGQLLEQAYHLARRDRRGRPREASLRRAISTAYYAVFRQLVDAACVEFTRGGAGEDPLRHLVARAFDHGSMNNACVSFAGGQLPKVSAPALRGAAVSPDLRLIARRFSLLQRERHGADYDPARAYKRHEVIRLVNAAANTHDVLWPKVAGTNEGRVFLWSLLLHRQVSNR